MRAIRFHQYGGPEVLVLEDAPEPHAGPGEVRIRVKATSVNPADWKIREGYFHDYMPTIFPAIIGNDAAGVVDEVGEGVNGVQIGDSVFGSARGGAAEFAVLTAWAPVPSKWTLEQAAAAGIAAQAALSGLNALGDISGQTILVEGAAGGVGSAAVEVAVARGATVIGTASEGNHDFLRELGATPITYGDGLADRVAMVAPDGVHAALDTAGSGSLASIVAIVGDTSRVATIADDNAMALGTAYVSADPLTLPEVAQYGETGAYTPRLQTIYPIERFTDAHRHVQEGHTRGKVVVTFEA